MMKIQNQTRAMEALDLLRERHLLADHEIDAVAALDRPDGRFHEFVEFAESVHLHVKVDDTGQLPVEDFTRAGAELDHEKDGFVKFRFPGGINAIFSHIQVAEEELLETEESRRSRPFLDHVGIDLREETERVRAAFDRLPAIAETDGFSLASQGGDRPVYCCHVEVAEKHWLYPPDEGERPAIPLEFAYGALRMNEESSGCDLRPANPNTVDPDAIPACCGAEAPTAEAGRKGNDSYYLPSDLGRFGEIGRSNPELGDAFFAYYGKVMDEGRLSKREKSLIALAVAHALKCPYCIDSLSHGCLEQDLEESEMMEAVQVAGAMAAGVTLVHSTQMLGHVDAAAAEEHDEGEATGT